VKTAFIVNPAAGRGLTKQVWPRLRASIPADDQVLMTEGPHHATTLARDMVAAGAERVVAVGGDGTATEVALGLRGSDVTMGHVPTGAGCDFAKSIGLPVRPEAAIAALDSLTPLRMDLGISGADAFLTVSGVGFDAQVAAEDRRVRRNGMRGSLPYVIAILKVLTSYRPSPVKLSLDAGRTVEGKALLVAVANCQYYAGGMRIAPYARPDDGWLDVVVVGDLSVPGTLALLPKVFRANHRFHPQVNFYRARTVRIESDPPLKSHLNGEVGPDTPVEFSLDPKSLTVLTGRVPEPLPGESVAVQSA